MRGSAESGSARGDAVVFIHGQPGSASDFNEIIHRLPPQLETVTYDRPGWGRNPNEVTDIDGNVKYLIEDVLGSRFAKVILVGYSYGSTVALKAAVDYPQRVGGLILLAPVGSMDSISLADRLLVIALRCLEVFPYYTVLKRWQRFSSYVIESFEKEQVGLRLELEKLSQMIPTIEHPVELIAGMDDFLNPLSGTLWLLDSLPNSSLSLLKNVGHLLTAQAPERIASKIFGMWSDHGDR